LVHGIYPPCCTEAGTPWLTVVQIGALTLLTALVVVHPRLQSPKWRLLRTCSFVATGLSAFAPIIHAVSIFPYEQLDKQAGLRYYYLEGVLVLLGVVFFTVGFPSVPTPRNVNLTAFPRLDQLSRVSMAGQV